MAVPTAAPTQDLMEQFRGVQRVTRQLMEFAQQTEVEVKRLQQ